MYVKSWKKWRILFYFGLYENETSKRAKIVIPAKTFFEKEDIRLSYGHQYVEKMNKVLDSDIGISEYDFTRKLFDLFDFSGLESESYYINTWLDQCKKEGNQYISPSYEEIPYTDGFGEEGVDEFEFIVEYDDDFINTKRFTKVRTSKKNQSIDDKFWLLSPKSAKTLNTQFKRVNIVQLHPDSGYKENERVRVSSEYGVIELEVHLNEDIRSNCVVVTNNTYNINMLTQPLVSEEGESACYQEIKVEIERALN